jgi:hypothetical protein
MESVHHEWTRASEDEMRRSLRLVEQQAEAFRQEAERARQDAERDVRIRLAPSPAVEVPEPPEAPAAPEAPESPPPPPWLFWFDSGPSAGAPGPPGGSADGPPARDLTAVIAEAREQLASALASYAHPIAGLGADESVTVAVDFVADPPRRAGPARTLLVRLRAADLRERQAGRLSAGELRSRLEFDEQDD